MVSLSKAGSVPSTSPRRNPAARAERDIHCSNPPITSANEPPLTPLLTPEPQARTLGPHPSARLERTSNINPPSPFHIYRPFLTIAALQISQTCQSRALSYNNTAQSETRSLPASDTSHAQSDIATDLKTSRFPPPLFSISAHNIYITNLKTTIDESPHLVS